MGHDPKWFYETPQVGKLFKNVIKDYIYCFESWNFLPLVELNTYGPILVTFLYLYVLTNLSVK